MGAAIAESFSTLDPNRVDLSRRGPFVMPASTRGPAQTGAREPAWMVRESTHPLIALPAEGAYWRAPAEFAGPLCYLAWGSRQLGAPPVIESRHAGWIYTLIEAGCPTLVRQGRVDRIPAPALAVIGPDCAFGWHDDPPGTSRLLVWMWRHPVHAALLGLRRDAFVRHALEAGEQAELRQLHALSRSEVHRGDAHSEAALAGLQVLIETCIARIGEGSFGDPSKDIIERAMNWIELHLAARQPLARLADFLGVSPATVQRLFRKHLGTTVTKTIAELRRHEAERMLANKGVTIKEVAYRLGYRHPHDFSRAFRKHSGSLPSRLGAGSVREQTQTIKRIGPPGAKLVAVAPQSCLSCV